jgi:hypothetical protein
MVHRLVATQLVTEILDYAGNSLYTYTQNQKRSLEYTIYRESSAETAIVVVCWLIICVLPVLFLIWFFNARSRRLQQEELKKPLVSSGHLRDEEDSSSDQPNSANIIASPNEIELKEQTSSSSASSSSESASCTYDMNRLELKIGTDEKV